MSKWQNWYDSLPNHTKEYMKAQPLWHDRDMIVGIITGSLIGLLIGLIF